MNAKTGKRDAAVLILICAAVYIAAYIGRLSYSASMVGIMAETGADKASAGLVTTCFYFVYGCGQLASAFLCRRFRPRPVVAGALLISAAANAAALCRDVALLRYIWMVNGAAQSVLWCALIELLAKKIPAEGKKAAILVMSTTVAIGTAAAYGIAALAIARGAVFASFAVAVVVLCVMCALWLLATRRLRRMPDITEAARGDAAAPSLRTVFAGMGAMLAAGAILAIGNGYLRDTMVVWTPSLLYDEFGVPGSFSVVITLVLPLLSIFGTAIAVTLHRAIRSYDALNALMFLGSAASLAGVFLSYRAGSVPGMILCAAVSACMMSGVNNVLTSMIPLECAAGAGLFAGLMDAFCYVGSTLSGVLPGSLVESTGSFAALLGSLPLCAAALAVFAALCALVQKKRKKHADPLANNPLL